MMDVDCGVDACNGDEAMVTDEDEIEDKQKTEDANDNHDRSHTDDDSDHHDDDSEDEENEAQTVSAPTAGGGTRPEDAFSMFDFGALGGYMGQVSSRLRTLLNDIKPSASPSTRLVALQELNDLLSFSTEEPGRHFGRLVPGRKLCAGARKNSGRDWPS